MNIDIEVGVCGLFKLETFRCDDEGVEIPGSRQLKAEFENLITDAGLNRMGSASPSFKGYCQVGSGSTPAAVTDTALVARIAGVVAANQSNTTGNSASAPWYGYSRTITRFGAGVAAGNISEVGMGWAATGSLFSRALVRDSGGSPTTITVLSDEFLDVTYEFRQYAPTTDGGGTINLGGVDYAYVTRAANANSTWQQNSPGAQMGFPNNPIAYTGAIGAITGQPSGTSLAISAAIQSYVNNSLTAKTLVSASPTQGNLSGGIGSIRVISGTSGEYQIGFTPSLPKNSGNSLNLTVSYSWARKTL